jgi:hypothetical protein
MRYGPNGPHYNMRWREQGKAINRYLLGDQVKVMALGKGSVPLFERRLMIAELSAAPREKHLL